jgi:hypothetical protein
MPAPRDVPRLNFNWVAGHVGRSRAVEFSSNPGTHSEFKRGFKKSPLIGQSSDDGGHCISAVRPEFAAPGPYGIEYAPAISLCPKIHCRRPLGVFVKAS